MTRLQVRRHAGTWFGVTVAVMTALACGSAPITSSPTPNVKIISSASAVEASSIMQVTFFCSRAADSDAVLAATAGPYVTHAESADECKKQVQLADSSVQQNKRALAATHWVNDQATKAQQVLADLARVSQLLADSNAAVAADDRGRLKTAISMLGDAEGQVEFDEFELIS